MNIIEPGSPVDLPGGLKGRVVRAVIEPNNLVSYVVAWWDGPLRNEFLLQACEVELTDDTLQTTVNYQKLIRP